MAEYIALGAVAPLLPTLLEIPSLYEMHKCVLKRNESGPYFFQHMYSRSRWLHGEAIALDIRNCNLHQAIV